MKALIILAGIAMLTASASSGATQGDIEVTFMASSRVPWPWPIKREPGEGTVHAFTCVSLQLANSIKEDCYGFYPAVPIAKVTFTNGAKVARKSDGTWIEGSGPFTFQQQRSTNPNELMLYDPRRSFWWRIPKSGQSQWQQNGGPWNAYLTVASFETDDTLIGSVKGPGSPYSEFEKEPTRFANVEITVRKKISAGQRSAILAEISKWQGAKYHLTQNSCIDLTDALVRASGLVTPARGQGQTPVAYLSAVRSLNP